MEIVKKVLFPNLRAEMARHGDRLKDLSEYLGISVPSLNRRLSNEIEWTKGEIDLICNRYNMPYEKLFIRE